MGRWGGGWRGREVGMADALVCGRWVVAELSNLVWRLVGWVWGWLSRCCVD